MGESPIGMAKVPRIESARSSRVLTQVSCPILQSSSHGAAGSLLPPRYPAPTPLKVYHSQVTHGAMWTEDVANFVWLVTCHPRGAASVPPGVATQSGMGKPGSKLLGTVLNMNTRPFLSGHSLQ